MTRVYRATKTISWADHDRVPRGELVIDPPDFVEERLADSLERLDEDGKLPRETLDALKWHQVQHIAANGDVESVNGNSSREDIVDAYAIEENDADGE